MPVQFDIIEALLLFKLAVQLTFGINTMLTYVNSIGIRLAFLNHFWTSATASYSIPQFYKVLVAVLSIICSTLTLKKFSGKSDLVRGSRFQIG